ncbi:hypothetical protein SCLCIDRAFT_27693 [Scleroderma citrinum Foug A]|uniref:Uncharacterized protein n=1 Tax=Scleroderma citrinum Foug A TaxID=1036808 RepID=A0A0C3DS24_9AGAM|nr:hypothetical protein SCLCIDRAFT_27693 [Scleroderma citrinum Foug A]
MVKTREKNKGTHPGQVVAPKPQKSKEEVASEQAAKAAASKQKADERLSRITGLASLEQRMMDECQQAMTHAARPPLSKARKIACTYSVHNLQSMQDSQSLLPVNQTEMAASTNCSGHAQKKATPKPKLRDEVQSVVREEGLSMTQGGQGKRKATCDLDKDLPVPRLNKRAKPHKPFGLGPHHLFKVGFVGQPISKPQSHCVASDSVNMPINDYGGFHEEDESVEQDFAFQQERTTLNSKMLLQVTYGSNHKSDTKPIIPRTSSKSNAKLPAEITPQFLEVFIPTLLAYCGTVPNPWYLPHPLQDIITNLWPAVFPQIPYNEQLYGSGTSAHQRIYDWHSTFVLTADRVTATWFDSDEFSGDESHAVWANWATDESLGFPFIFKYLKLNDRGVGAFRAPLVLQTLVCHYAKTANAVSCPQVNTYLHGALTLATTAVERTISMWAKFALTASGAPAAPHAQSIEMLKSTTWEEIEDGALEFAKFGRRFKTVPSGAKDVCAYIMDCDSDDNSISSSINGHHENKQECAASLVVERNWELWNCDEDMPSPPSALTAPQILDSHTASPQPTQLQSLVSADTAAFQPRFQTTVGVMDTCQQLPHLTLACSQENTLPFVPETSAISLPPLTADQFSVHCSPAPALASENMSRPDHRQVHQHSVPDQGSSNHTNMWQDPYMMPSGLRFGNKFLTGPLRTIDADNDLDY